MRTAVTRAGWRSGLSWEAGASTTAFTHAAEYNYREFYAGLASDRLSGRLYLAPAYYGYGGRVAYAELNGFYPLRERIKLIGHVGALHGLSGPVADARDRIDVRLAIGFDAGACQHPAGLAGQRQRRARHGAWRHAGAARARRQRLVLVLIDQIWRHF